MSFWLNFRHWLHWKLSICDAASGDNFVEMETSPFQYGFYDIYDWKVLELIRLVSGVVSVCWRVSYVVWAPSAVETFLDSDVIFRTGSRFHIWQNPGWQLGHSLASIISRAGPRNDVIGRC